MVSRSLGLLVPSAERLTSRTRPKTRVSVTRARNSFVLEHTRVCLGGARARERRGTHRPSQHARPGGCGEGGRVCVPAGYLSKQTLAKT